MPGRPERGLCAATMTRRAVPAVYAKSNSECRARSLVCYEVVDKTLTVRICSPVLSRYFCPSAMLRRASVKASGGVAHSNESNKPKRALMLRASVLSYRWH